MINIFDKNSKINQQFNEIDPLYQKIIDIVRQHCFDHSEIITPLSNFYNDLGCDSLDCVEIIMDIEKEFNIHIDEEEFDNICIVKDLYNQIINLKHD